MSRKKSANDKQTAIRLPREWLARIDDLAEVIAPELIKAGVAVTRSDILRASIYQGILVLEKRKKKTDQ